jgi:hypothetical protein
VAATAVASVAAKRTHVPSRGRQATGGTTPMPVGATDIRVTDFPVFTPNSSSHRAVEQVNQTSKLICRVDPSFEGTEEKFYFYICKE